MSELSHDLVRRQAASAQTSLVIVVGDFTPPNLFPTASVHSGTRTGLARRGACGTRPYSSWSARGNRQEECE
jgi:hypothetical protein